MTNGTVATPTTAYAINSNTQDFFRAVGPLKVNGQVIAASGSTLSITRTAGDSYVEGRNYSADPNSPNYILAANDPALNPGVIAPAKPSIAFFGVNASLLKIPNKIPLL